MSLRRYHTPQLGGGMYVMRGGSLTRYYTPHVQQQRGGGLQEQLLKIAGPAIIQAAQSTMKDIQGGKSALQAAQANVAKLKRNLKRKAPRMIAAAGSHAAKQQYKKAKRRVKDIFSL